MFEFYWPWMSFIFFLPWFIHRLFFHKKQSLDQRYRQITLLHPHINQIKQAFNSQPAKFSISFKLYRFLLSILWLSLTLAMMRPQWIDIQTKSTTKGYDLYLVIDTSHSMEALDFKVDNKEISRMKVVKDVMNQFIELRLKDRLGLIIFGSQPYVITPLTSDIAALQYQLKQITPRLAGNGTAIGDALGLAIKKLRQRPKQSRVIILIADGDNTTGLIPVEMATALAKKEHIRIYTIGVGSNKKNIAIMEDGKRTERDDLTFDEAQLKKIALITGGTYFRATNSQALTKISKQIDRLEKTQIETQQIFIPTPLYRYPLIITLTILLLFGFFPELRGRARLTH